jgi:hypothetical protein
VNIYPREVENALIVHPGVVDVAVIGMPDEEIGESVPAVVQSADPSANGGRSPAPLRPAVASARIYLDILLAYGNAEDAARAEAPMTTGTSVPIYYDPFNAEIDRDVHAVWQRMREEQPVYRNDRYGFWVLSRFGDVWTAYRDTATFSSTHGVMPESLDEPIGIPMVLFMDPPEHDWMRKLVSAAFTPRRIAALEAHIAELVDRYLDPFAGSPGFDYVEQFGALLPPMVIGHMLGVAEADRDMVRRWFDAFLHHTEGGSGPSAAALAAVQAMDGYTSAMIAERRRYPRDDMISVLIEGEINDGASTRRLSDSAPSRNCCATRHHLPSTAAGRSGRTAPTGSRSRRARRCCCSTGVPTGTRGSSPTPTGSTCGARSTGTSPSDTAPTTASARHWP